MFKRTARLSHRRGCTRWIVATLLVIHAGLLAFSSSRQAPTIDEPPHLLAGLSYWEFGRFDLFRVNPPLPRLVAALPVLATDYQTDWSGFVPSSAARPEFSMARRFVTLNDDRFMAMLVLSRWACIPFSLLGAVVCYRWGAELYGVRAGLLSLLLWSFSPTILAHGQLNTCDVAAASFGSLAMFMLWQNLRSPSHQGMFLSSVSLGFALLCKTTLILFLPLVPVLWLIGSRETLVNSWRNIVIQSFGTVAVSLFIVNLGYGFEDSCRRLGDFKFSSRSLTRSVTNPNTSTNRFNGTLLQYLPVPLPANYVLGIDAQKIDHESHNQPSYMHGAFRSRGWPHYYVYAALVKIPAGTWLLVALVTVGRLSSRGPRDWTWRDELVLLAPAVLVFLTVSSQTRFTDHFRYILPVFPMFFIWIGQVASRSTSRNRIAPCVLTIAACWSVVSCLATYPHTLSYFNEFVGGPTRGDACLLGSNLDWGQDLMYLKKWQDDHQEATPLYVAYWGIADPSLVGMQYQLPPFEPTDGWHAVSINILKGCPWPIPMRDGTTANAFGDRYLYFQSLRPQTRAGYSIMIYHIKSTDPSEAETNAMLPPE